MYVDVAGSAGQGFNTLYDKDLSGGIGSVRGAWGKDIF